MPNPSRPTRSTPVSSSPEATIPARTRAQMILLAFCLSSASSVGIGFGRFGYSLVLPAMRADLGWTYGQAGALNTANALGYLLGAIITGPLLSRWALRRGVLIGLAASVLSLLLAGLTQSFWLLLLCRALVGVAAALTFIAVASLGLRLGRDESETALTSGLVVAGPSLGVVLGGFLLPAILAGGQELWPRAWQALAAIGVFVWLLVFFMTRSAGEFSSSAAQTNEESVHPFFPALRVLSPTLWAYFWYGVSYIAYMTFLVAYVRDAGGGAHQVTPVWAALGTTMFLSTFVWKKPLSRYDDGRVLAMMGCGGAISAALPLLHDGFATLILSAAGFGLFSMPIFTAVSMLIRRNLPVFLWSRAVATSTVIFAIGQSIGPLGAGTMSDHFGLRASLLWTTILMALAALVSLRQKSS